MNKIVDFPGEHITPEEREKDRWVSVAFCAAGISGRPRDVQVEFLKTLLRKFADAPDKQPSSDDIEAYAKFAVKRLIERLIEGDSDAAKARAEALDQEFLRVIQEGLPDRSTDPEPPPARIIPPHQHQHKGDERMTDMTKDDEATCHAILLAVGEMVEGRNAIEVISGAISALAKMAAHSIPDEPPETVRDFAQKVGSLVASAIVYVHPDRKGLDTEMSRYGFGHLDGPTH